jgi:hypothetical protein
MIATRQHRKHPLLLQPCAQDQLCRQVRQVDTDDQEDQPDEQPGQEGDGPPG